MNSKTIVLGIALAAWFFVGCQSTPITQSTVDGAKRQRSRATQELKAAQASLNPIKGYIDELTRGDYNHRYYLMLGERDILDHGEKAFLPYSFPAQGLYSKLRGTFTTVAIRQVQMTHGNRLRMQLQVKGKGIKVLLSGAMYKSHLPKIKAGLEKGMILDLSITLKLKGENLLARASCDKVQLLQHNTSTYTDPIKSAINKHFSKRTWTIGLPTPSGVKPTSLLTTPHHVVIFFD